jgi:hypothetical protein
MCFVGIALTREKRGKNSSKRGRSDTLICGLLKAVIHYFLARCHVLMHADLLLLTPWCISVLDVLNTWDTGAEKTLDRFMQLWDTKADAVPVVPPASPHQDAQQLIDAPPHQEGQVEAENVAQRAAELFKEVFDSVQLVATEEGSESWSNNDGGSLPMSLHPSQLSDASSSQPMLIAQPEPTHPAVNQAFATLFQLYFCDSSHDDKYLGECVTEVVRALPSDAKHSVLTSLMRDHCIENHVREAFHSTAGLILMATKRKPSNSDFDEILREALNNIARLLEFNDEKLYNQKPVKTATIEEKSAMQVLLSLCATFCVSFVFLICLPFFVSFV